MTREEVANALEAHNKYRRGYTDDPPLTPAKYGEALDLAIKYLREDARKNTEENKAVSLQ